MSNEFCWLCDKQLGDVPDRSLVWFGVHVGFSNEPHCPSCKRLNDASNTMEGLNAVLCADGHYELAQEAF